MNEPRAWLTSDESALLDDLVLTISPFVCHCRPSLRAGFGEALAPSPEVVSAGLEGDAGATRDEGGDGGCCGSRDSA